jgi:mRNA-degrading endonuclease toxin of MazEF toxin-antitoxin module
VKAPGEGDVVELDDDSPTGPEQRGRRPAFVVSIPAFQETGLAIACPIATHGGRASKARSELEVAVPPGFAVEGFILTQHLRAFDWKARKAHVIEHLPRATLLQVRARLKVFLGL